MKKSDIRQSMASGKKLVGAMVYWTELTNVRVARPLVRQGIDACGLSEAMKDEPGAEAVLNRAVAVANRRQGGDGGSKKHVSGYAELKRKDPNEVTYAVLMRRDQHDRTRYIEEARVTIDRTVETPRAVVDRDGGIPADPNRDKLVDTVVEQYEELLKYMPTMELSELLVRCVRDACSGLTLKSGFYIVRPEMLTQIGKLQKFLADTVGASMHVWEIAETPANRAEAKTSARESLRESIDEVVGEVERFMEEHTDPNEVVTKSIAARVERFKQIDARVQLYADILGDYRDELTKAIDTAKQKFLAAYMGDDATADIKVAS